MSQMPFYRIDEELTIFLAILPCLQGQCVVPLIDGSFVGYANIEVVPEI